MSKALRCYIIVLASILMVGASSVGEFGAVHAHLALLKATPKNGATVTESPEVISLKFSGKPATVTVHLFDGDGDELDQAGEPELDGKIVNIPLISKLPNGTYKVTIRAVSKDAHVVNKAIKFTVKTADENPDVTATCCLE